MRHGSKGEKGFTLVELLTAVAIIGILASIALPQYSAYREKGCIASMQSDASAVRLAEEAYFSDNGAYVATTSPETDLSGYGTVTPSSGNSVAVTAKTSITRDYVVTVTSTGTSKTVTFDSTTGATTTS